MGAVRGCCPGGTESAGPGRDRAGPGRWCGGRRRGARGAAQHQQRHVPLRLGRQGAGCRDLPVRVSARGAGAGAVARELALPARRGLPGPMPRTEVGAAHRGQGMHPDQPPHRAHHIYPRVAEGWFSAVHELSPGGSRHKAMQVGGAVLVMGTTAALLVVTRRRGRDPRAAALWAPGARPYPSRLSTTPTSTASGLGQHPNGQWR
jgi:hypothetical protein